MTHHRIAWRAAFAALGLTLALSACENDGTAVVNAERTHKINVSSHYVHTPVVLGRDNALEPEESAKLAGAIGDFIRAGGGVLDIAVPKGAGAQAKADVVRNFAIGAGARRDELNVRFTEVAGDEPVVVSYERYVATPPNCRPTQDNMAYNPRNLPQDTYGCATQHNLAIMVSNPADLVRAQRETPADPTRRSTVIEDYRAGDDTSSEDSVPAGSAASF